jgi:photosystem II stability/assembly factor-like uncharacterized protein
MFKRSLLFISVLALGAGAGYAQRHEPKLTPQQSGTTQLLIAVSPVDEKVVWAAGAGGTYAVTRDGGDTWKSGVVPGADALQFRDVQGVSAEVAYLMSIGDDTDQFRIYKTEDGGAHWKVQFTNQLANAFYDCMAFWTPDRGIAHSDSVNGVFPELRTTDGRTWHSIAKDMPPALAGEASFSSSGTCVATQGWGNAWIATGGSTISRILATRDGGDSWKAYDTPLVSNENAGGLSVAFRDPWHGIVGGGDLTNDAAIDAATSSDGGKTWTLTKTPPITGAIFCLAYVNGQHLGYGWGEAEWGGGHEFDRTVVITTETQPNFTSGAAAWSPDEGQTWHSLPTASGYWAVAFANPHAGWFVGNNGTILKISF